MCGRYAASASPEDLVEEFEVEQVVLREDLGPDYNVAPTASVPAILSRPVREEPDRGPVRRLTSLRWGLIPSWAKERSIGAKMINARMETVADKPAYRRAFASRRCLLPADGYYEWYPTSELGRGGKPVKQPFFIRPRDGSRLAMAGLYEIWRDPAVESDDDPDAFVWSSTVLTTSAEDSLGHIHDRMPLIVEPERWDSWLGTTNTERDELLGLLVPAAPGRLDSYPVSIDVNSVRNNGPHLLEPLAIEPVQPTLPESP
ncbi:MAG: SOS response-associated peptidase [Nocardioidaceae bacterium]|nr:SOS response-associated peptidase [Nocardioidaceae bacterium]